MARQILENVEPEWNRIKDGGSTLTSVKEETINIAA